MSKPGVLVDKTRVMQELLVDKSEILQDRLLFLNITWIDIPVCGAVVALNEKFSHHCLGVLRIRIDGFANPAVHAVDSISRRLWCPCALKPYFIRRTKFSRALYGELVGEPFGHSLSPKSVKW